MRYVLARYETEYQTKTYRIYVTDALKVAFGLSERYADFLKPDDPRTAEEIVDNIKDKLREINGSF